MWPFRKNRKGIRGKGIIIPHGSTIQIPLPPVRFNNDECFIWIGGREEQLDENGFIIEIQANNTRPIRAKIFPDFKNKRLDYIEIIDVNDKNKYSDGPKLEFAGVGSLNQEDAEHYVNRLIKHLNDLNKDMLRTNKKLRKHGYISIAILLTLLPFELYFAYTQTGLLRYTYLAIVILSFVAICIIMWSIKNTNKIDKDIEKDAMKENKKIEIVKEK